MVYDTCRWIARNIASSARCNDRMGPVERSFRHTCIRLYPNASLSAAGVLSHGSKTLNSSSNSGR